MVDAFKFSTSTIQPNFKQKIQIKSFIILAVLGQSVQRVGGAYLCVIAPKQHTFFRKNVAAVASRWQHCVRFDEPRI